MIVFCRDKSIFESHAEAITNTVNCVGVMGKGIAAEYKSRFPQMFEDYRSRCQRKEVKPGLPYIWEGDDRIIVNFPSKDHWRDNSRIEWVDEGLLWIRKNYRKIGITSLAMPPIGCGNGGLYWTDVKSIMEKHFEELDDLIVSVYLLSNSIQKSKNTLHDKFSITKPNTAAASPQN